MQKSAEEDIMADSEDIVIRKKIKNNFLDKQQSLIA